MVLNKVLIVPSTIEIVKTIVTNGEFDSKSPLQRWSFLYGIGRSCLKLLQFKIYEEDQTLNLFSYVSVMYSFLYLIFVVYTAVYYISHNKYHMWLPSTCLFVGPIFGVWTQNICFDRVQFELSEIRVISVDATDAHGAHKGPFCVAKIFGIPRKTYLRRCGRWWRQGILWHLLGAHQCVHQKFHR